MKKLFFITLFIFSSSVFSFDIQFDELTLKNGVYVEKKSKEIFNGRVGGEQKGLIVKGLKEDLQTHSKNLKDKVVKIKMQEAIKSIDRFCGTNDKSKIVKDSYVVQTMRYLELLKEVKKSGNKKQKVI